MTTEDNSYYILTYHDPQDEEITSLQAKTIGDSNLGMSFICVSDFMLDDISATVIDPKLEKLRVRFEKTKSLHLSIYNIISIEEIGMEHTGLIFQRDKANLLVIPRTKS